MDYRILFSRQKLRDGSDFFQEIDVDDSFDPGEMHRKLSRQVTLLGYQIAEDNIGIMRRPLGDAVGDVFSVLHGVTTTAVANAGIVVYGLTQKQYLRNVWYESHVRIGMSGEYYPSERRSNLSILLSGQVASLERVPEEVARKEKGRWLFPPAQQAYGQLRYKLGQDLSAVAVAVRAQLPLRREGTQRTGPASP